METPNQAVVKGEKLAIAARAIDERAKGAMELFKQGDSFEKAIAVAQAMGDLRALLTPEVMAPIMALANSKIGFDTDRNPNKPVWKDGKWETPKPYPVEVVRDCVIEATLRGFKPVGNEFNIIAGNFYGAKSGFRRLVTNFPGMTEFRDLYDVPRMAGEGAIITCRASWKLNGHPDTIECTLAIRVNKTQGADAIQGKAERKLLKRVLDRITGMNTPEGEIDEEALKPANVTEEKPNKPTFAPDADRNAAAAAAEAEAGVKPRNAPPIPPEDVEGVTVTDTPEVTEVEGGPILTQAQKDLGTFLSRAGVAFEDFRDWAKNSGRVKTADQWGEIFDVSDEAAAAIMADKAGLAKCARLYGKGAR